MQKRTIHSKYLFADNSNQENSNTPIIVGYHLRTPENLGNIIRLADNTRCQKVLFVTGHENLRTSKIKKTAASSFNKIDWSFCTQDELKKHIPDDYSWVAVETTSDSKNIFETKLPEKTVFIVGNEIHGVHANVLELCKEIVHIPMIRKNTSMNVSHALAVALFEWQRQITGKQ